MAKFRAVFHVLAKSSLCFRTFSFNIATGHDKGAGRCKREIAFCCVPRSTLKCEPSYIQATQPRGQH